MAIFLLGARSLPLRAVQEGQEALAVPVFGGIAHEDAEILLRIVADRLVVDDVVL